MCGATRTDGRGWHAELVALDESGRPDFHRLSSRMLHGRPGIGITLFVFDVLAFAGLATTMQPYSERRELLVALELETERVRLETFKDGEACSPRSASRGTRTGPAAPLDASGPERFGVTGLARAAHRAAVPAGGRRAEAADQEHYDFWTDRFSPDEIQELAAAFSWPDR